MYQSDTINFIYIHSVQPHSIKYLKENSCSIGTICFSNVSFAKRKKFASTLEWMVIKWDSLGSSLAIGA